MAISHADGSKGSWRLPAPAGVTGLAAHAGDPASDSERSTAFATPESHVEHIELEDGGDTHQAGIDDFARAILDDREPEVPGEEGIKQVELSTAMVLSSCRGRPVEIPVDRQEYDGLLEELRARHSL